MRIDKHSSNEERRILIGMIVDDNVLMRIGSKWKGQMFKSRWANIIANWCLKYYEKYSEAPLNQIESLYETWANKTEDKSTINLVDKFLSSLSEEYEELKDESNSDYIIDMAGRYFNQVQIERLLEETQSNLDRGDVSKAHEYLSSYNQIEMGLGEGIDVFSDKDAIKETFAEKREPLITYPSALGKFFGTSLERDAFVSFVGPEGRGKSFWLLDVAFRAMCQRRKVAFFQAGDMSRNQTMMRFMIRASRHPAYPDTYRHPKKIRIDEQYKAQLKCRTRKVENKLNWKKSIQACKKVMRSKVRSKKSYFKLSAHPNSTLSVKNIEGILQDWEKAGWIPDVIVIDYADILDMNYHGIEGRDRINETWKRLRSLSQKLHCLVVTATQSDAASYEKELMTMSNFSDDKRKNAHVTGMVGINQTPKEKEDDLTRLNWIKLRESKFHTKKCVYVAGCLPIANPAVISTF